LQTNSSRVRGGSAWGSIVCSEANKKFVRAAIGSPSRTKLNSAGKSNLALDAGDRPKFSPTQFLGCPPPPVSFLSACPPAWGITCHPPQSTFTESIPCRTSRRKAGVNGPEEATEGPADRRFRSPRQGAVPCSEWRGRNRFFLSRPAGAARLRPILFFCEKGRGGKPRVGRRARLAPPDSVGKKIFRRLPPKDSTYFRQSAHVYPRCRPSVFGSVHRCAPYPPPAVFSAEIL